MGDRILLLAPSAGLGGGIERYADGFAAILDATGVPWSRLNLRHGDEPLTLGARLRFVRAVRRQVRASADPVRLVLGHAYLLPTLATVSRLPRYNGGREHARR